MSEKSGLSTFPREQTLPTCNVPPWINMDNFTASHINTIAASKSDPLKSGAELQKKP